MANSPPHVSSLLSEVRPRRLMTALGLDIGTVRIGVGLARAGDDVALDLTVIVRKGTRVDVRAVLDLAQRHGANVLVVGLPPGADEGGRTARIAAAFAAAAAVATGLPTMLVDEADTTLEADLELRALGLRAARRKRTIDQHAARILLGRWLAGAPAATVAGRAADEPG